MITKDLFHTCGADQAWGFRRVYRAFTDQIYFQICEKMSIESFGYQYHKWLKWAMLFNHMGMVQRNFEPDFIQSLVDTKVDPDVPNKTKLALLLERGANPGHRGGLKRSALFLAKKYAPCPIHILLLEARQEMKEAKRAKKKKS
ncbi:hypothetical protein B0J11DRAFT_502015 [Dendryphion nanum]|uniref:Uncharacterized protein n=1 Tax=Dendryphion nanum TaxID=256645 RepID=A0A9P9IYJ3_9PLEO|nr:hypothetical protein B0J11DRAFT_502015 [Dendryphion nanum]